MLFDAYVMIDWSGGRTLGPSRPAEDNIWVGDLGVEGACQRYFRGRHAATEHVRARLAEYVDRGARVLVGFDFPYGYPAGLSRALALDGVAPWRAVWDELGRLVHDDVMNVNNRFDVAAELNSRIAGPGPFWGCPPSEANTWLTPSTKGLFSFPVKGLARLRATEAAMPGVQETWKLYGAGSVGSQAMLGIPRVRDLRDDPAIEAVSGVWPFETGFTEQPIPPKGPFVLHAEIWPGIVDVPADAPIRDQAQVRLMCEWAARHDAAGTLGAWFAPALDPATAVAASAARSSA